MVNWKKWGIVITVLLLIWTWQQWPDEKLHVVFCDVGQGDASVVVLGAFQTVIDTGANENRLSECLAGAIPFWDRKIEVVFLSHSDKDHTGALSKIKELYQIERVVEKPRVGDIVRYVNLSFDILKGNEPVEEKSSNTGIESNETSVVMRLTYGDISVLYTGDIDTASELALVSRGVPAKTTVLKVSHHGSKYGSVNEFVRKVEPRLAIISVGAKNSYGHPAGDTLMRLAGVGAKVLRTDLSGTISLITDGKSLEIYTER